MGSKEGRKDSTKATEMIWIVSENNGCLSCFTCGDGGGVGGGGGGGADNNGWLDWRLVENAFSHRPPSVAVWLRKTDKKKC